MVSVFQRIRRRRRRMITSEKSPTNDGKFSGINVTFSPILKTFSLRKIGGFWPSEKKKKKKSSSPVSGFRSETRARVVLLGVEGRWRGCGRGYRNVALQLGLVRVSRLADSWLLSFVSAATVTVYSRSPISAPLGSRLSLLLSPRSSSTASTSVTPFNDSSRVHFLHGLLYECNPGPVLSPPSREKTSSSPSRMEWKRTWPRYIRE